MKRSARDIILLISMLAIAAGWYALSRDTSANAVGAIVWIDGFRSARLSLEQADEFTFERGGDINVVRIENGTARIVSANCPGGDCTRQRAISRAGELIVCVPHKLMITLESVPAFDTVAR
ncbi:MAG: NusG domain II-containing protein [Oscillospiraceae bacterium]|jgi:hypothetical protein|nr:NusG domain II-containing protein [Oscillospiraceae bacterium]